MKLGERRRWAFGVSAVLGFVVLSFAAAMSSGGCSDPGSSYCSVRCACDGCSQRERDDCVDDVDDAERLADFDGCADVYAEYVDCYVSEGFCSEKKAWVSGPSCIAKGTALRACSTRAAKFVKTACQEERDKFTSCGLSGGGSDPCTPDAECVALCSLAASCSDLTNPQTHTVYVDCVLACSGGGAGSSGSGFGP